MERKLYEAAYKGDIKIFKEITEQLNTIVTLNKNTILHVNIAFKCQPSSRFVEQVVQICPSLIIQANENGDTPLHFAAKYGRVAIVETLIKHARAHQGGLEGGVTAVTQMLRMTNNDGNTALHVAVQNYNSIDSVKLFIREDPNFPYDSVNNCGETPLYIAASRGSLQVVTEILETYASASYKGPCGMTVLHAAVKRNNVDMTKKILENNSWTKETNESGWSLIKETDENGWTPLHYAAYYGYYPIVKLLVNFDASAAYIADKCRKITALHLASGQRHFNITSMIIASCPACIEQVDNRGWNYAHFAMCSVTYPFGLRRLLGCFYVEYLLDAKDVRGNTPLLVLATIGQTAFNTIKKKVRRELVESTMQSIYDQKEQFHDLKNEVLELSKVRDEPYKEGVVRLRFKDSDHTFIHLKDNRDIYLVVTALIATVTFAAGLTLPGGYIQEGSNKGTAVLIKNSAFQAFVIANATALVLSVTSLMLHILWHLRKIKKHNFMILYAHYLTIYALIAMVVAFVTGTYAMLRPSSGLAITIIVIGISIFLILIYVSLKRVKAGFHED